MLQLNLNVAIAFENDHAQYVKDIYTEKHIFIRPMLTLNPEDNFFNYVWQLTPFSSTDMCEIVICLDDLFYIDSTMAHEIPV